MSRTPVLLAWSGGKDAAWTLHLLRQRDDVDVVGLLTTVGLVPGQPARVRRDGVRVVAWRDGSEESTGVSLPGDIASHVFVQVT